MTSPATAAIPAGMPPARAMTWYVCGLSPNALVHTCGMIRPMTWPMTTPSMPKWNSGLPMRSSLSS
jgi:hypothetical protein